MRFLFYPNFSTLNMGSFSYALGHVLFTLSIGFTSMVTFGKHLSKNSKSSNTGFTIGTIDSFASILAGMLIFPLIVNFVPIKSNPMLLFQTVPRFFLELNGGSFFGFCFFLFLYLGALGASISLLDTLVANAEERNSRKRSKMAFIFGVMCLLIATLPAFSSNFLKNFSLRDKALLECWDFILINIALPLTALIVSQLVVYFLPLEYKKAEFNESTSLDHQQVYSYWNFALKYLFPVVTVISLVTSVWYFLSI